MKELRHRRQSVREEITGCVATLRALLQDPDSPTVEIRKQLRLVNGNYAEMKALDDRIWDGIDDDEFDADLAVSYEFDAEVVEVRTHVEFARPSAALSRVAAKEPGAPSPDFAFIRHGKTTALSGGSEMAAEADGVEKVHPACEPCFSELPVLTVGEESTSPGQVAERASDPLKDRLKAPSSPTRNDCVVHADNQGTGIAKVHVATTHDDAADPDPPNVVRPDGPDVAIIRGRSLVTEHVAGRRELAPSPLVRRWPRCSQHWRLRWRLGSRRCF